MNNDQMAERIRAAYESGDLEKFAEAQREMMADDMVQEWPQSGERIRGRKNIEEINQNYPASTGTNPKVKLKRILKPGEAWIVEATIDYGDGVPVSAVSIIETGADGKAIRQTDYFANPFEAPAWRADYVERMQPAGEDDEPGDRGSDCQASMEPIAITVRKDGEWVLIHRCQGCGTLSSNRTAGDDNPLLLVRIAVKPLAQPPFPLDRLALI